MQKLFLKIKNPPPGKWVIRMGREIELNPRNKDLLFNVIKFLLAIDKLFYEIKSKG